MDELLLDDIWNLYFHDPDNKDWNFGSYNTLHTMSSAEDYWSAQEAVRGVLHQGMFFLMREHVFPCWDDIANRNGGCFSVRVPKTHASRFWEQLAAALLGETLAGDRTASVTGISIRCGKQDASSI
jgi:hypothetical protein